MRVHSINELNTKQQHNPFVSQNPDSGSTAKTAGGLSFEDHLRSYLPQTVAPTVNIQAQNQVAGMFWGFHPSLKVQQKPESTLNANAY